MRKLLNEDENQSFNLQFCSTLFPIAFVLVLIVYGKWIFTEFSAFMGAFLAVSSMVILSYIGYGLSVMFGAELGDKLNDFWSWLYKKTNLKIFDPINTLYKSVKTESRLRAGLQSTFCILLLLSFLALSIVYSNDLIEILLSPLNKTAAIYIVVWANIVTYLSIPFIGIMMADLLVSMGEGIVNCCSKKEPALIDYSDVEEPFLRKDSSQNYEIEDPFAQQPITYHYGSLAPQPYTPPRLDEFLSKESPRID